MVNIAPLAQEIILDYAKITTHPKFAFLRPDVVVFAKGNASDEDDPIGHLAKVKGWPKVIEKVLNGVPVKEDYVLIKWQDSKLGQDEEWVPVHYCEMFGTTGRGNRKRKKPDRYTP